MSISTPFLSSVQEIFNQVNDKPLVVVDAKFIDLQSLVHFMYYGQVDMEQERLSSFLQTAESLKVKGLAKEEEEQSPDAAVSQPSVPRKRAMPPGIPSPVSVTMTKRQRFSKPSSVPPQSSRVSPTPQCGAAPVSQSSSVPQEQAMLPTGDPASGVKKIVIHYAVVLNNGLSFSLLGEFSFVTFEGTLGLFTLVIPSLICCLLFFSLSFFSGETLYPFPPGSLLGVAAGPSGAAAGPSAPQ